MGGEKFFMKTIIERKNLKETGSYKENKIGIGSSDVAALVMDSASTDPVRLKFGADGNYNAYVVTSSALIPDHYTRVYESRSWLRIFDDNGKCLEFQAPNISVWRAGEFGCIVCLEG